MKNLIVSDRTFGVEIEFQTETEVALRKLSKILPIVGDGSIRHLSNTGEYVSEILKGNHGEDKIMRVCEVLKKHNASSDHVAMSVHIHLDAGMGGAGKIKSSSTLPNNVERCYAFSPHARKSLSVSDRHSLVYGNYPRMIDLPFSSVGDVTYISRAIVNKHPKQGYIYYWIEREDRTPWLKKMLYFYTQYSDVMEGLVSNSRRFGNMYCIPLGKSYDLSEIEGVTSSEELQSLWYKGRAGSNHYDDSRYHNVNFHSVWNRTHTVEIRSHGGTTDPQKILLWLRLHQYIADRLEEVDIEDIKSQGDMNKSFLNFLSGDELLVEYASRLLGYFSRKQ